MTARQAAWLRLAASGADAEASLAALARLGGTDAVARAGRRELEAAGLPPPAVERMASGPSAWLEPALEWLASPGQSLLAWDDPDYPPLLRAARDAPLALFVVGDRDVLSLPHFAIVGSRNPTVQGAENAHAIARRLAQSGIVVCSGLATGIDTAAHRGALDGGAPTTAVLGCGAGRIYPAVNAALAERIAADGLLLTEYPPGVPPLAANFPRRNRIISGLSAGVLVVEAAHRSGSLITARLAGEQGREVFAVPGSIHNPLARGCHQLIRQGAVLVESADDILREIAPRLGLAAAAAIPAGPAAAPDESRDASYAELLETLGHDPASVDELALRTGLTAAEVSSMMLILELQGAVESMPGGRYARVSKRS
jgi:DNA processing protein